ncbi:hypothetical protein BWP39_09685 [Paraburkholderia acidicola]|uniref:Uncharacterized protein n=1 Tax=Paraburkholderia acidicola TaxID=1912599 RepID=A0A2A4F310_9BURK|nr:hypothetical protein BWP39_09685 [Paraburkholderia acidicola]
MWQRFLLLAAAGAVVAGFALLGAWSLYCRDLVKAVLWSLLSGTEGIYYAAANSPDLFWSLLLAYVAVVFIVCRYTQFRLTWPRFAIGIVAGYTLAALITGIFVSPDSCNLF